MSTEERVFITSGGVRVPYRPVSEASLKRIETQVETEFRARGEPIDPLTYPVGGDLFEHDQDSIDDPVTDDETRAAWALHRDAVSRMEKEQQRRAHRARLIKGILLEVPEEWIEFELLLGAQVPDDLIGRKMAYFEDIFVTVDDWKGIIKAIAGASLEGAGEEALQAMENLFQREMGRLRGDIAKRASSAFESGGSDVVPSSTVPDRDDDERVGDQE